MGDESCSAGEFFGRASRASEVASRSLGASKQRSLKKNSGSGSRSQVSGQRSSKNISGSGVPKPEDDYSEGMSVAALEGAAAAYGVWVVVVGGGVSGCGAGAE